MGRFLEGMAAVYLSRAMRRNAAGASALLLAALTPSSAVAHDYWLLPDPLVTPAPRRIPIGMFVGDAFVAEEERPHQDARTTRVVVGHKGAFAPLAPTDGATPAYAIETAEPGDHLVVVDRNLARITLEPAKFEKYLRDEGLEPIVEDRRARGESDAPGRERYTRWLKTLVAVGDGEGDAWGMDANQTLEIVPASDPTRATSAAPLAVGVRFRGAPLANAFVEAVSMTEAGAKVTPYRTDARGVAEIAIDRPAIWMVRLVHMVRCEGCDDADWESFWSSYTFASRPADPSADVRAIVRLEPKPKPEAKPATTAPEPIAPTPYWLVGLLPAVALGALLGRLVTRRR